MAVNPADFYSAAQNQKADATQRAAEVRKKLLKGAAEVDAAASPEESLLIGQWMDARHSQVESEDQYRSSASGRDEDFG
jgi:hypothetical protein